MFATRCVIDPDESIVIRSQFHHIHNTFTDERTNRIEPATVRSVENSSLTSGFVDMLSQFPGLSSLAGTGVSYEFNGDSCVVQ